MPATLRSAPVPTSASNVDIKIYGAKDVRDQLIKDQHYKCAYCESKIPEQYHDVEHYRPKSLYFWLGHKWSNLLYSCELCNRSYKNSNFPLKDELNRAKSQTDDITLEEPLIINPAYIDPNIHIKFNRYSAIGITPEGNKTIEIFHLNDRNTRPDLINGREQLYEKYEQETKKITLANKLLKSYPTNTEASQILNLCNQTISSLKSDDTPYSGMLISQI